MNRQSSDGRGHCQSPRKESFSEFPSKFSVNVVQSAVLVGRRPGLRSGTFTGRSKTHDCMALTGRLLGDLPELHRDDSIEGHVRTRLRIEIRNRIVKIDKALSISG